MILSIGNQWEALSGLTGITIGDQFYMQNAGRAGDLIEVIINTNQPTVNDRGAPLRQFDPIYRVSDQTTEVWVRAIKYTLQGGVLPEDKYKCLLDVTQSPSVSSTSALPDSIYTAPDQTRRLKVSTATREELQITRGEFFVGNSTRLAIPTGNIHYSAIIAPSDKFLVIEDVIQELSFTAVTDGTFVMEMSAFVDGSVTSSFSYTPLSPTPIGRAMISSSINTFPDSTVDIGVTASSTGNPEYPLTFNEFYIDTGGNRNTLNQSTHDFFAKGRQLVLAPNGIALVRAQTTGNATGTADIRTTFFTSEIAVIDL